MSDARRYAVWPEPRSRSRSVKGSRPSVPHGTNFSKTESEPNFSFPHIPTHNILKIIHLKPIIEVPKISHKCSNKCGCPSTYHIQVLCLCCPYFFSISGELQIPGARFSKLSKNFLTVS